MVRVGNGIENGHGCGRGREWAPRQLSSLRRARVSTHLVHRPDGLDLPLALMSLVHLQVVEPSMVCRAVVVVWCGIRRAVACFSVTWSLSSVSSAARVCSITSNPFGALPLRANRDMSCPGSLSTRDARCFVVVVVWLVTSDDRTSPICIKLGVYTHLVQVF